MGGLLLVLGLLACAVTPMATVSSDELRLDRLEGRLLLEGVPYTGRAITWAGAVPQEQTEYRDGRRNGLRIQRYPDGRLSAVTPYRMGRREGLAATWWPEGGLRSEVAFVDDVAQGLQRQWYRSGAPFKELHLLDGKEVGMQRAWRENGAIYNNYEARDGRIYGLRRSKLCFQLQEGDLVLSN